MRPRYTPLANVGASSAPAGQDDQLWPASVTSVNKTTTRSDCNTPTLPAALSHHDAITAHEKRLPTCDRAGRRPAALSMKSAALVIARSSASAHSAAGATGPSERKNKQAEPQDEDDTAAPRRRERLRPPPRDNWHGERDEAEAV